MTPLALCNLALARIGSRAALSSLTEASPEAYYCGLFFDQARDATLMAEDWRFATAFAALALTGTPPPPWAYQYALPADCLKARALVNPAVVAKTGWLTLPLLPPLRFERGLGSDDAGAPAAVLWTNQAAATLVYTARVENPDLWEAAFVAALSWQLAAEIAVPITGSAAIQQAMAAGFAEAVAAARNASANQAVTVTEHVPDWLRGRFLPEAAWDWPLLTQYPR